MTSRASSTGMPVVTLWQPWASLIALGVKTIETRSWPAPPDLVGERIAIHAAVKAPAIGLRVGDWGVFRWHGVGPLTLGRSGNVTPEGETALITLPLGAVVATARLAACLPMVDAVGAIGERGPYLEIGRSLNYAHTYVPGDPAPTRCTDQLPYGDFAPGRWAWLLEDVEQLPEPVPARGRQKVWRWTP